jgi:hypothetical protein
VPAVTLAYDDLPPGSDIRRVCAPDNVQISVPAAEPPRDVLKQAAMDALASGAAIATPILALAVVAFYFGIRANRISGVYLTWAWAFFAIFCTAIVMLVAWIRYSMITDGLRAGRSQSTAIGVTSKRFLVATSGPFGVRTLDLPREQIVRLECTVSTMRDNRSRDFKLTCLSVHSRSGPAIHLLPARDPRELRWVCGMIRQTMQLKS